MAVLYKEDCVKNNDGFGPLDGESRPHWNYVFKIIKNLQGSSGIDKTLSYILYELDVENAFDRLPEVFVSVSCKTIRLVNGFIG